MQTSIHRISVWLCGVLACTALSSAQSFTVSQTGDFTPQHKKVLLLTQAGGQKKIILFKTDLRVNTDGSPRSYHPQDLRGQIKALNNICNAIVVTDVASGGDLCRTHFSQAITIFEKFRDSGYQTVPAGFRITWANVLASADAGGKKVPCVFATGEFQGYFGSLTALKNDLPPGQQGECQVKNQLNPLSVPALVLVGGTNVVEGFGAREGDLLFAYNPATKLFSAAIIGDIGPHDNLGEGSVFLNMSLLGKTTPPVNKTETFKLSIQSGVLVAIIPGSRSFQTAKPYTAANIDDRVKAWQKDSGFATPQKFIDFIQSFNSQLK